jgi:hypothetical protein
MLPPCKACCSLDSFVLKYVDGAASEIPYTWAVSLVLLLYFAVL